jgi:hypothetical protein
MPTILEIKTLIGDQNWSAVESFINGELTANAAQLQAVRAEDAELLAKAKADADAALKAARAEGAGVIADKDSEIVRLQAMIDRDRSDAAAALKSMTAERDAAIAAGQTLRATLVQMANVQREALKTTAAAIGEATAINTQALADDDAEKVAQQKAEAARKLAELDQQRAELAAKIA